MKTAIKINGKPVTIPTTWEELTYKQYAALSKDQSEAFEALTGVSANGIDPLVISSILSPLALLIEQPKPDVKVTQVSGRDIPQRIGKLEFARKSNVNGAFKKYKDIELLFKITCIYCAPGIEDEDIESFEQILVNEQLLNIISAGEQILQQLNELSKSEAKIKKPDYRAEEWQAGVNDFKKYGDFGLVRGIALRYGCTIEDVFKWSYNKVLMELKISADESAYQRKLNDILSKRK